MKLRHILFFLIQLCFEQLDIYYNLYYYEFLKIILLSNYFHI